jgi:outer membrane lipoprotein SlyB
VSKMPLSIALSGVLLIAACSAPSQPYLDTYRVDCAKGSKVACDLIPETEARVNAEHNDAAGRVAGGILLGFLAVAAGAAAGYSAAHQPATEVVVVCRPWWAC